jgi:branched-chain amino acid transport system ATP-binding protein
MLEVKNVTKRFGGLTALHNVSFEVEKGSIIGIIGPNGAGKTTLFNVITGFLKPEGGKIFYERNDITGMSPHEIAKMGIARTFQIVKPFPELTVEEAVRVGAYLRTKEETKIDEIVDDVLEFVGIERLRDRYGKELNLIQLKLTEIARALATQPKLLLVDEVVAGLTPKEIDNIIDMVKKINEDKKITVCLIEHIMRFIMRASQKIIVLHHGEKIFEGKPEEAYNNEKVIKAYLGERRI